MDIGEQMEVVVSMVAGKKPGAFITLIGVATVQITFKVNTFSTDNRLTFFEKKYGSETIIQFVNMIVND